MKQRHRNGTLITNDTGQDRFLQMLYGHAIGRMILKPMVHPAVSRAGGWLLSTRISCLLIPGFVKRNHIDMKQFEPVTYRSYNEFFARKIRPGVRPVDEDPRHLISPCDSKLTIYPVASDNHFLIKHTRYTVASLLRSKTLAKEYNGGYVCVFRLTVDDYHRFCYVADGEKEKNVRLPGMLHTVNPVANDHFPIYKENAREYSILHSDIWGDIVMMEVGALLVGKIVNHHQQAHVRRGQEKGYFQFGGSTVVLIFKPGAAAFDADILENSASGIETIVKMGEKIGISY